MAISEEAIKVFISYSWDDEPHKKWVLQLANRLAESHIHVILDQYDLSVAMNSNHFMEDSVETANKVVIVMTPTYKQKADARRSGVGYEYSMITQELFEDQDKRKFIPIVRGSDRLLSTPKFLKSLIAHQMNDNSTFEKDLRELVKIIYEQPSAVRPPLGKKPEFSMTNNDHSEQLIDTKADLQKSGMTTSACWKFTFTLHSLKDKDDRWLYRAIQSNLFKDALQQSLPDIFDSRKKIGEAVFETPLRNYQVSNHFIREIAMIDQMSLKYSFAEYSNQSQGNFLNVTQPFQSLLHILISLKKIHLSISRNIDVTFDSHFSGNARSILLTQSSPFPVSNYVRFGEMLLEQEDKISMELSSITLESMFELFDRLYQRFKSSNVRAPHPYCEVEKQSFYDTVHRDLGHLGDRILTDNISDLPTR